MSRRSATEPTVDEATAARIATWAAEQAAKAPELPDGTRARLSGLLRPLDGGAAR